jgi:hypothetical protein
MGLVSLNARLGANAQATDQIPVMLVTITGAGLPDPVYLSSDPTERISSSPLVYGTRHGGNVFQFVLMSAVLPDDKEDSPPKTTLIFENVSGDMAGAIRASITPATIRIDVVMAGTPDVLEASFTNLRGVQGTYDQNQVSYDVSREPFTTEPMPAGRMTQNRFPGLHS